MSDLGNAVGGVGGLAVAGVFLVILGNELDHSVSLVDLSSLGVFFVVAAVVLAIILVVAVVKSILG